MNADNAGPRPDCGIVVETAPEGIVHIPLNRPDRLNALGVEMTGALLRAINAAVDALGTAPMATNAVINGLALGGGCEIALACDLRPAAHDAQLGLTGARIGAMPGAGGTQRMPRVIGASRALELMLTGEPADYAERLAPFVDKRAPRFSTGASK